MTKEEIVKQVIISTIKKAESTIPNFKILTINESINIYGGANALLDSLNLISFIFLLEEEIEVKLKLKFKFETRDILLTENPPFANLDNLVNFICSKINHLNL